MSKIDNGGSAFPKHSASIVEDGMSLRDYLAAKAIIGLISSGSYSTYIEQDDIDLYARTAYRFADAMLVARREEEADNGK